MLMLSTHTPWGPTLLSLVSIVAPAAAVLLLTSTPIHAVWAWCFQHPAKAAQAARLRLATYLLQLQQGMEKEMPSGTFFSSWKAA